MRVKGETGPASQREEWRHEGPESGEWTGASWAAAGVGRGPAQEPGQAEAGNRGFKPGLNLCVRSQSCWMWGGGRGRMGWPAPHPRVEPRSSPVGGPGAERKCPLSPDFLAALSRSIHSLGVCLDPEQSCGRWGLPGCRPGTTGHGTGSGHGNCVLALCGI